MNNLAIEKIVELSKRKDKLLRIHFKSRKPIEGFFIVSRDYKEMKRKNFWRIVIESRKTDWTSTEDIFYSRLFNGDEITKITDC